MFPLGIVVFPGRTVLIRALSLIALAAISALVSVDLLVYFAIWLLGTVFSRVRIEAGAPIRWLLFAAFLGSGFYFHLRGHVDDLNVASFNQDLFFAFAFVLWLSSTQIQPVRFTAGFETMNRIGQFFANFSFTLYVLHIPVIMALVTVVHANLHGGLLAPDQPVSYFRYLELYVAVVAAAYLLYLPFEANTQRLRSWMKRIIAPQPVRASV
jgi:hypothetical protein